MEAIHTQLRQRILDDCDAGVNGRAAAVKYSVSVSFITKLKAQRRDTGSIEPRPHGGGRRRALVHRHADIRRLIEERAVGTVVELHAALGEPCTPKTVWLELRRLGYRFKKSP